MAGCSTLDRIGTIAKTERSTTANVIVANYGSNGKAVLCQEHMAELREMGGSVAVIFREMTDPTVKCPRELTSYKTAVQQPDCVAYSAPNSNTNRPMTMNENGALLVCVAKKSIKGFTSRPVGEQERTGERPRQGFGERFRRLFDFN